MSSKKSYITLINEFWEIDNREPFSNSETRLYFYLLQRINRNHWNPVFISDRDLAEMAAIARSGIVPCRDKLKSKGLITCFRKKAGHLSGIIYMLPEPLSEENDSGPKISHSEEMNGSKISHSEKGMAQKQAINGLKTSHSPSSSPIIYNKTYIRHTTQQDSGALPRDLVAVVEPVTKKLVDDQSVVAGAASRLMADKERAAEQGAETLKAFFNPYNQQTLETQLMQYHLSMEVYRTLAQQVIADWTEQGVTHDDLCGHFNIKDAIRHLQNALRKKAEAYHRRQSLPKSREQLRMELMEASYSRLQRRINGQLPPEPEFVAPF